jgi:hypothetical protein
MVSLMCALAGLASVTVACGGPSKAASTSVSTTVPASAGTAARAKFVACLEAHGVPAPVAGGIFSAQRPGSETGGSTSAPTDDRTMYASALQACRSDLPSRLGSGGFRDSAAAKAYLDCLEAHGVTVPTTPPTARAGATYRSGFGSVADNPAFKTAQAACAGLRPTFGGAPNSTTSTTG